MRPSVRGLVLFGAAAVAAAPIAAVLTVLLLPVWRRLEAAAGVEAVGHSGPAGWCHALTWAVTTAALCLVLGPLRRRPPARP